MAALLPLGSSSRAGRSGQPQRPSILKAQAHAAGAVHCGAGDPGGSQPPRWATSPTCHPRTGQRQFIFATPIQACEQPRFRESRLEIKHLHSASHDDSVLAVPVRRGSKHSAVVRLPIQWQRRGERASGRRLRSITPEPAEQATTSRPHQNCRGSRFCRTNVGGRRSCTSLRTWRLRAIQTLSITGVPNRGCAATNTTRCRVEPGHADDVNVRPVGRLQNTPPPDEMPMP